MSQQKEERKKLSYAQVITSVNFLKGKILTIVESLGLEVNREKAVKDLIHDKFGTCTNDFWRHTIGEQVYPEDDRSKKDK